MILLPAKGKQLLGILAFSLLVFTLVMVAGRPNDAFRSGTFEVLQLPAGTPTPLPYPLAVASLQLPIPRFTSDELPYPPPGTLSPQPTERPTSTRPPEVPTSTPPPTLTPAPPTLTPTPLPTLVPSLQTFVYATTGEQYPEVYRVQVDLASRVVESAYLVHTPELWHSRTYLLHLYPSPDGRRVALWWAYGDGGSYFVSILHVDDGRVEPLLGEGVRTQKAIFLSWTPDGNSVLVLGFMNNSELRDGAWLVDVRTHEYREIAIKQVSDPQRVFSASFSPDGTALVYGQSDYQRHSSGIWRIALDGSEPQLLLEVPEVRVEDVLWSPEGDQIAFTQWRKSTNYYGFALGELWVMKADGSESRLLAPAVTGVYKRFIPAWSPNGQQIVFVQGSTTGRELDKLSSNVCIVDMPSGAITQLTDFQGAQVLNPAWSSDGSHVTFAVRQEVASKQFEPWVVAADSRDLYRLGESAGLVMDSRGSDPVGVWLATSFVED